MPSSAPSPHDADALYAALQAGPLAGSAITVLHIGAGHSSIASGNGNGPQPQLLRILEIGSRATAMACLRHDPPTAHDVENAIATVEDAIAPLQGLLAADSTLHTADPGIRQIALRAGLEAQPEMDLPRDAVEDLYQRVAGRAMAGAAAPAQDIEGDQGFIATLLILRECLQHLGFDRIAIRSDTAY